MGLPSSSKLAGRQIGKNRNELLAELSRLTASVDRIASI